MTRRRAIPHETRNEQVKAAVSPKEKRIFERLAALRGKTLSDLIRDFLLAEEAEERLAELREKS